MQMSNLQLNRIEEKGKDDHKRLGSIDNRLKTHNDFGEMLSEKVRKEVASSHKDAYEKTSETQEKFSEKFFNLIEKHGCKQANSQS